VEEAPLNGAFLFAALWGDIRITANGGTTD
jgi:hypothetical protein